MNIPLYISQHFFRSPTRVAVTSFSLLILVGTILLKMPFAVAGGNIRFIDALFTCVSAGSVTGLSVVDTGTYFTLWGQLIIMFLIQIGGVGIMTFSTLFILMAGRKTGIVGGMTIKDTYTQTGERKPIDILFDVLLFTFMIEGIGAVLLFFRFVQQFEWPRAAYLAIFHSVGAFCNAGFSLFPNNLMAYRGDWFVSLVISGLIISGGIGFLVFFDIKRAIRTKGPFWRQLSLQSKLALVSTIILLLISTGVIFWMEMQNSLLNLPLNEKILASFFEAVTARTAGFNTIDQGMLSNGTLFFVILLMFIGAGAGSCGGGVKITTVSVLMLLGLSHVKGEDRPQVFYRSLTRTSMEKAVSAVFLSALAILVCSMAIETAEEFNPAVGMGRGKFLDLLFETVSAFGTVGLSTGITGKLTDVGKFILCMMMFIGKLGPLTLALTISNRRAKKFHYAEENVMIG